MNLNFFLKKNFYKILNLNKKKKNIEEFIVIKKESKNWVLNQIADEYKKTFLNFNKNISFNEKDFYISKKNSLFVMSKYYAIKNIKNFEGKIYFPYFHGIKDTEKLNIIKKNINFVSKIQVSNTLTANFFAENNIPEEKYKLIPITIDLSLFDELHKLNKENLKEKLEIPKNAFVLGSFQKDGNGWNGGTSPKLIKGPDVFIKTLEILKNKIPELFILLTGPSRGYVKKELNKLNISFKHVNFEKYSDLIKLYKCLDVYLISSREEGGPRAIPESFASRTPLVTTNVGLAADMIKNNFNGFKSNSINPGISRLYL